MMTFLLTTLFLLTILGSFAFGIAAAYWVICKFLDFFDPARTPSKPAAVRELAPTSGD
jgi:hypothetical protein